MEKLGRSGRGCSERPLPTFQGPIPSRDELSLELPTYLPSKDNRPFLALRCHLYRMRKLPRSKDCPTTWFCIRYDRGCKVRVYTKTGYRPGDQDIELLGGDEGLHSCATSRQDVLLFRAKAEISRAVYETDLSS